MYHPLYEEWKKAHPKDKKPDYFVSANDLTPEEHVMVQADCAGVYRFFNFKNSKRAKFPYRRGCKKSIHDGL